MTQVILFVSFELLVTNKMSARLQPYTIEYIDITYTIYNFTI